jgi:tetratricopeptide (TPR) repeat protein
MMNNSFRLIPLLLCIPASCALANPKDKFQTDIPSSKVRQLDAITTSYKVTGNSGQAESAFKALIGKQPDYYAANYNLGLVYADEGKYPQAIDYLEAARSIRERKSLQDATIYNSLGWTYMLQGNLTKAEANFVVGKNNEDKLTQQSRSRLYNNLGLLYMYQGRYAESREALTLAAEKYDNKLATNNLKTLDQLTAQRHGMVAAQR